MPDAAPGTRPETVTGEPSTDGFGDELIVIGVTQAAVTGQQSVLGWGQQGGTAAAAGMVIGGPQHVPLEPASGQMTADDAPAAVDDPAETATAPITISAANSEMTNERRI